MTEINDDFCRFTEVDIWDELPSPGYYQATITTARIRLSASNNRMIQVGMSLHGIEPGRERVNDYFVLEGATPTGRATARRRLVQLYRACGLDPKEGDEIRPGDILHAEVQVKVDHDERWESGPRLRPVHYESPPTNDSHLPF